MNGEIVTEKEVLRERADTTALDCNNVEMITPEFKVKLLNTIQHFANLLEEECECSDIVRAACLHCESCRRKAAAMRQYKPTPGDN
jgi:hypothetical protein